MARLAPLVALAIVLVGLFGSAEAHAHTRSTSWAVWTIHGTEATVRVRLTRLDETALLASESRAGRAYDRASHLQRRVVLSDTEGPCTPLPGTFSASELDPGQLRAAWTVRCAGTEGPWEARSDLLFGTVPAHAQMVSVSAGESTVEGVLTATDRQMSLQRGGGGPSWSMSLRYGWLGVWHILTGWDHLVFMLVLVVVAGSLRGVAIAVTGFTLGHSATLSLSVLGFAQVDTAAVEALIGLSIALVAAENVWLQRPRASRDTRSPKVIAALLLQAVFVLLAFRPSMSIALVGLALFTVCTGGLQSRAESPERVRWTAAALFGLLHGFGFAASLHDLAPSPSGLAAALVGFNIGVELGQLAVLVVVWPMLLVLRAKVGEEAVVRWSSAVAVGLGVFWFVSRAWVYA